MNGFTQRLFSIERQIAYSILDFLNSMDKLARGTVVSGAQENSRWEGDRR